MGDLLLAKTRTNPALTPIQRPARDTFRGPTAPTRHPMSKFESISGRALELAGSVGDTLRERVPDRAMKWIETGAALGAVKAGSRAATTFVRRNPAVAIASAVGAGVLLYAVRRHQRKLRENAPIEGKATRIEAKKAPARKRTPAKRAGKTAAD